MKINIIIIFNEQYPGLERVIFDFNKNVWFTVYENIENTKNITFVFRKEHHRKTRRLYNFLRNLSTNFDPVEE